MHLTPLFPPMEIQKMTLSGELSRLAAKGIRALIGNFMTRVASWFSVWRCGWLAYRTPRT